MVVIGKNDENDENIVVSKANKDNVRVTGLNMDMEA